MNQRMRVELHGAGILCLLVYFGMVLGCTKPRTNQDLIEYFAKNGAHGSYTTPFSAEDMEKSPNLEYGEFKGGVPGVDAFHVTIERFKDEEYASAVVAKSSKRGTANVASNGSFVLRWETDPDTFSGRYLRETGRELYDRQVTNRVVSLFRAFEP